ncbi:hypothetical protein [Neptuniibacter sp. QD37_11]|uniref:hypothetical protein n=1 Tax=Neptuniibacter sp. QD37_11 TaxID=3398209 RepID=UPI0039F574C2
MPQKENEFYLRDTRSNVGSSCQFWRKGGCGYTTDLSDAEVFDFDGAQRHASDQGDFIPLSKKQVDELATIRVDMQLLNDETQDYSMGFVIQRRINDYDGNDIFFEGIEDGSTVKYSDARVYQASELEEHAGRENVRILSKSYLDRICRPTLQFKNVNRRKMMTSAGIRYRAPRKPRPSSGKTRHNCPTCGKIVWDYNPYEAPYCDIFCEPVGYRRHEEY